MPLSPNEELELLQLEEEEYQHSLKAQPAAQKTPAQMTPEEIAAADEKIAKEVNYSEVAPILAGAAQGSTFGFSDEMGAGLDVAGDMLHGKTNDIGSKWRAYQKQREAVNKQLQEESPGKYLMGELGGGLASAAVMPSIGGARIAAMGSKVAPGLGKLLAGEAGGAMSRIAGKAATGMIEGAPIGAAYGVGSSEHDLSQPLELGADMLHGAGMGSITGATLTGGAKLGQEAMTKAGKIVDNSRLFRQMKEAYNYGTKGKNLGDSNVQDELSLLPNEMGQDLVSKITAIDQEIGQKVGSAITNAQEAGLKINVDPKLNDIGSRMYQTLFVESPTLGQIIDPKTGKLLQAIAKRELGDLNPVEAKALRDELYKLSDNLAGYNSDTATFAKKLGMSLAKELDSSLKNAIPEYQAAAKEFETFRRMVPETIIGRGTPSEYGKVFMGDLKNPELKLFEGSREMLKGAQLPGMAAETERQTFEQLSRNLRELEKTNPSAVNKLGGKGSNDVIANLKKKSDELGMLRQAQGVDPQANFGKVVTGQVFGFAPTAAGQGMSIANKAGRAIGAAAETTPVKMGSQLFKAGNDQLLALAGKLKGDKATALVGETLENALNNKSEVAKHAVLFKLMQDPNYRNLLKDEGLTGEDE